MIHSDLIIHRGQRGWGQVFAMTALEPVVVDVAPVAMWDLLDPWNLDLSRLLGV